MIRVVKPNSKSKWNLNHYPAAWKVVLELERGSDIPAGVPLTSRARSWWESHKSALGYANFRTLRKADILSILSASKRAEARLGVNRWGACHGYKLFPTRRIRQ